MQRNTRMRGGRKSCRRRERNSCATARARDVRVPPGSNGIRGTCLEAGVGYTQFGRAMQQLNIDIICANTPAAKGRVERAHQTLQDRLAKELRLRGAAIAKPATPT